MNERAGSGLVANLGRLARIFTPKERGQLAALTVAQALQAVLEAVAVGLVLPLVALFSDPSGATASRVTGLAASLGIHEPRYVLVAACAFVFAFYALKNLYTALLLVVHYRIVFAKQVSLSTELLNRYMHSPWTLHLRRNSAVLLRNVQNQVTLFITAIVNPLQTLVSQQLVSIAIVALLVYAQPVAAALAFVVIGGAGFFIHSRIKVRLREAGTARQQYRTEMIQSVQEALGGLKEARLLGREQYFVDVFAASVEGFVREYRIMFMSSKMQRLALEMLVLGGALLVAGALVLQGNDLAALLPTIAMFGVAMFRLLPSINSVAVALAGIRYYWPVVENLDQELSEMARFQALPAASEEKRASPLLKQRISVRSVSFRYPDADVDALANVSLDIPRGSAVAIVGPSGAGKSTLVDVILGLLPPRSGCVLVDGTDIATCTGSWQRTIGYVPQHVYLLDSSVRRNVAFGVPRPEIDDGRVWSALEQAQIADVVGELPDGLDTTLGEHGARLSGGQRQRIGIARALYAQPEILVFDEATSAVDIETERQLSEAIAELGGRKTLIIIAHRPSTVAKCDLHFELDRGRLVGTSATVAAAAQQPHHRQ